MAKIATENLTIGRFAMASGVTVATVSFYQRKGLLPQPRKPCGGTRRYGAADVARVRLVQSAQRLGLSLDEIADLLRLDDGTHCDEANGLAKSKLLDIRGKLVDLARIEAAPSALVSACDMREGDVNCPLIASLQSHNAPIRSRSRSESQECAL